MRRSENYVFRIVLSVFLMITGGSLSDNLPIRDSETSFRQPDITAKMSTALKYSLVPESILFALDGIEIPEAWTYFNVETSKFRYLPPEKLEISAHSLILSVTNSESNSIQNKTTFEIRRRGVDAPHTLLFDGRSPVLELAYPVQRVKFDKHWSINFQQSRPVWIFSGSSPTNLLCY